MKSCHLNKLYAVMACIIFLFCGELTKAAEAEEGLMLCTDNTSKNRSNLVIRPALLATQKPCNGRGIWEPVTGSNLTATYGQCLSINIACLVESSPGFESMIEQITALNETGEESSAITIPVAANNAIKQRSGVAVLAFVLVSQVYMYAYAGAGFYDTLGLSALAAAFCFVQPQVPASLWSLISSWIPEILQDKEEHQPSGSAKKGRTKTISIGKNMHKLDFSKN